MFRRLLAKKEPSLANPSAQKTSLSRRRQEQIDLREMRDKSLLYLTNQES